MKDLAAILEEQLGLVPGWLLAVPCTAFLYVCLSTRNILGCIFTENIKHAWSASATTIGDSQLLEEVKNKEGNCCMQPCNNHSGIVLADKSSVKKAVWGVRMMWTNQTARRKGIATKLLDSVRSQLARGCVLPRADLAFSQPTPEGAALIQAYIGSPRFLVYEAQITNT
jgi:N-acetyltransferase